METKWRSTKGRTEERVWLAMTITTAAFVLLSAWLAFVDTSTVAGDKSEHRKNNGPLTEDSNKAVRIVTYSVNGTMTTFDKEGWAGEYYIRIRFFKEPAAGRKTRLVAIVLDRFGERIPEAKVEIEYFIPSLLGGPPAIPHRAIAQEKNCIYYAGVDFSMSGDWVLRLNITTDRGKRSIQFPVEVLPRTSCRNSMRGNG